ncbi:hypothetical protein TNCV_989671 [Trichonephila clavipes]|nr:hypothetical protein TNCV_989671 [Trichonephila clavipes]
MSVSFKNLTPDSVVQCKLLTYANFVTIVILCACCNLRHIWIREANRSYTRFQVKEDDVDSTGMCFTGEIVLHQNGNSATEALLKF